MQKTHMVACVDPETAAVFENICADNGVSVSSVLSALMESFLDSGGADAQKIIQKAKKTRQGRPRAE